MCMCVGVVNCVGEKVEGRELSHMKELWQARRFSFIHEACPKDVTQDFFMQALYSSALGKQSKIPVQKKWWVFFSFFWTGHQHPELIVSKHKHFLQRARGHQICTEDLQNTHFYSDLTDLGRKLCVCFVRSKGGERRK